MIEVSLIFSVDRYDRYSEEGQKRRTFLIMVIVLFVDNIIEATFASEYIENQTELDSFMYLTTLFVLGLFFMLVLDYYQYHRISHPGLILLTFIIFYTRAVILSSDIAQFVIPLLLIPLVLTIILYEDINHVYSLVMLTFFILLIPILNLEIDNLDDILPSVIITLILGTIILIINFNNKALVRIRQNSLQTERNRYKELFENIPVGVWDEDFTAVFQFLKESNFFDTAEPNQFLEQNPDLLEDIISRIEITDINRAGLEMFKIESIDTLISKFSTLFSQQEAFNALKKELLAIHEGIDNIKLESSHVDIEGELHNVDLHWSLIRDEIKNRFRVIMSMIDVTERKQAQEALKEKERQLVQAQKMEAIGQLAGGIAHDFNNVLTIIIGYSEMIMEEYEPDSDIYKEVREIRDAAKRASTMVRQLLTFSRKHILDKYTIELNRLITDMMQIFDKFTGPNIEFTTDLSVEDCHIRVNQDQISMILSNLILNATDAMPEGGKIMISTRISQQSTESGTPGQSIVELKIEDNGVGIPDEIKERIFEPFFTTKKGEKGTGLGLTMVYAAVTQNNGTISFTSEENKGTAFSIYFPLIGVDAEDLVAEHQEAIEYDFRDLTILIVEDETTVRDYVSKLLRTEDIEVMIATDGNEGYDVFQKNKHNIDLILSDIIMPKLSGIELSQKISVEQPDMRIILMTGFMDEEIGIEKLEHNNIPVIKKPFTKLRLLKEIANQLK